MASRSIPTKKDCTCDQRSCPIQSPATMYSRLSQRIKYIFIFFVIISIILAVVNHQTFNNASPRQITKDEQQNNIIFDLSRCPTMKPQPVQLEAQLKDPQPDPDSQKPIDYIAPKTIPQFNPSDIQKVDPSSDLYSGAKHDKWIVLTTISLPTDDVKFLANMTGWKVVVVGDTKTPNEWSYPNCVYLSVDSQLELGLSLPRLLPTKHYARKNAGYLYAIANGATVIYETDDDNRPVDNFASFDFGPSTSGLMFSGDSYSFNPYRHFGQPTLWPRGYPLSQIGADVKDEYRLSDRWPTPAMQQGVVNGDPDMDAVFRLTRKITLKPLDVAFDPSAPSVILPPGIFSPFNTQNTLFLKDAFWGLLIPTTTTFRMCDIWRGYWSQRLLWEIGGNLGFTPPNAYQKRNAHDYMADMVDEKLMYFDTDRLLMFLTNWMCPSELSFFQCVFKLTADMAVEKFWLEGDVKITQNWLEDLVRIGYPEPRRLNVGKSANHQNTKITSELKRSQALVTSKGSAVKFAAARQFSPRIILKSRKSLQAVKQAQFISSICPDITSLSMPTISMKSLSQGYFHDILLVVVFKSPVFKSTEVFEAMYRPIFPNIVYCGNGLTQFEKEKSDVINNRLTFIDISDDNKGSLNLRCAVKAMEMNYHVKGHIVINNDVLLNVWNLGRFDKNKVWIQKPYISDSKSLTAYVKSIELLKSIEIPPSLTVKLNKNPPEFVSQLTSNNGGVGMVANTVVDTYYIPKRLRQDSLYYVDYFMRDNSIENISLANILHGIEDSKSYHYLRGASLMGEDAKKPLNKFSSSLHFIYPVEFSMKENVELLCQKYFPVLLEKLNDVSWISSS